MDESEKLHQLAHACADACLRGSAAIVVDVNGSLARGMPRGRFVGQRASGARTYDMDPVKVLAWIRKQASMTQNAGLRGCPPKEPQQSDGPSGQSA